MPGIKYIAAGFVLDAEKLLADFVKENSPEFSVFTNIWKKHNFAAIFLGRSSTELQQFTHEIFQLTLKFLVTTDLLHQIGGVYLLYALFRNQIIEPPTRIRIILKQYQHFLELKKLSAKEKYKSLHYVISYLLENSFDLVAHPTLVGPRNSKHRMELEKNELQMNCLFKDLKNHSLPLLGDNSLEKIQELDKAYKELTRSIPFRDNIHQEETDWNLEIHMKNLSKLVGVKTYGSEVNSQSEVEHDNIGSRRAQIKSDAFASKALFRQLNPTDDEDEDENQRFTRSRAQRKSLSRKAKLPKESTENESDEESDERKKVVTKIKRRRRTRIPKERRRLGRPRKGRDLEQLLLEELGVTECNKLRGIRKRGPVARSSYLDRYIEQPFKEPDMEIAMLSTSTSEEEEEEENIDEPEEVVTLEDDDDDDLVITF